MNTFIPTVVPVEIDETPTIYQMSDACRAAAAANIQPTATLSPLVVSDKTGSTRPEARASRRPSRLRTHAR